MKKKSISVKAAVIAAYLDGVKTVDDICDEFGVARRTVYKWLENSGTHRNRRMSICNRQPFYVSKDEAALLCTLLETCEYSLPENEMNTIMRLHDRLTNVLNEFSIEETGME